jgi:hypothetical protein
MRYETQRVAFASNGQDGTQDAAGGCLLAARMKREARSAEMKRVYLLAKIATYNVQRTK